MTRLQKKIICKAVKKYGSICGCSGLQLIDGFRSDGDTILFWFNDKNTNSTHMIIYPEPVKK